MPFIAESAARTLTDLVGESSSEFLCPQPDRLMRDNDATSGQHVFDHPQAQGKTEIEPHRVGNDFSGKAVATVERITVCHASSSPIKPQVRKLYDARIRHSWMAKPRRL